MVKPLEISSLYHACDLSGLAFETTAELAPLSETIGQERALEAINFGVNMFHEGFNLYVMGSPGLGRHTVIRHALEKEASNREQPSDWCYVANFEHPHCPQYLEIPAGMARRLRRDMGQLIDDLLNAIPAAFQGDEYQRRLTEIQDEFKEKEESNSRKLGTDSAKKGIALIRDPTGFTLAPLKDGKVLSPDEFSDLPDQERKRMENAIEEIKKQLKETISQVSKWHREMHQKIRALDGETMELTIHQFISELIEHYRAYPKVTHYIQEAKQDFIENVDQFRQLDPTEISGPAIELPQFNRYKVNILVDNIETKGAPIVFEDNPTYQNLIGRIEHIARMGTLLTDFTLIKSGALHKAIGGYLILDAEKVLSNPFAWEGLKRTLRAREIRIESIERQLSLGSTISLEPQPIPINLKVVLVGTRLLYHLLKAYDPEFSLQFKVTADFAEEMHREDGNEQLFARLIATLQQREELKSISRTGVERIIEHSARTTWDGQKMSLHMGSLIDLLQEANYCATRADSAVIRKEDIQAAIQAQEYRASQLQEQLRDQIINGTLKIDTDGVQLAQINGLSVIQIGDYAFGAPSKISATARIGSGQLIDIEREIDQGGTLHSKGVLILTSYLGERYAKHQPLSVSASLVFEQTYGMVDGDSASAAELCALLSALGDLPINQAFAITGSINQHGQVQAIGGVNQKIEGFFDICDARGLTGEQSVIIPSANIKDLMLKQQVLEAVEAYKFRIIAVDHVEQAMELLCDLPAGIPDANGLFPENSINGHIQYRLAEWTTLRLHYSGQIQE
ncbi:MAG: peptidase [Sedimenticola sp.]|nr:MAG: peptidase [Sedimenticola sp.]